MMMQVNNKGLLGEIWSFLKVRKAWWLLPIIVMLLLVRALIVFGPEKPYENPEIESEASR